MYRQPHFSAAFTTANYRPGNSSHSPCSFPRSTFLVCVACDDNVAALAPERDLVVERVLLHAGCGRRDRGVPGSWDWSWGWSWDWSWSWSWGWDGGLRGVLVLGWRVDWVGILGLWKVG
jgi:hypothetical protein